MAIRHTLDDERTGIGPGPSELDCLLFAGHLGVSIDLGRTIFGFHPAIAGLAMWRAIDQLRNGGALPGVVQDDTGCSPRRMRAVATFCSSTLYFPTHGFKRFERLLTASGKSATTYTGSPTETVTATVSPSWSASDCRCSRGG
jgi:hypothetical protein